MQFSSFFLTNASALPKGTVYTSIVLWDLQIYWIQGSMKAI